MREENRNAFDTAASTYDETFTNSSVGKLQRNRVYYFLKESLQQGTLKILEINCGTGADAIWLAEQGHEVIATDRSSAMTDAAGKKISKKSLEEKITVLALSFGQLRSHFSDRSFDLIFSDFGGLNCVAPDILVQLSGDFYSLLKPNGKFIAVVMGRKCLWERFYFMMKLHFKKAFRRNSKDPVEALAGDSVIPTWYYSPREFSKIFETHFKVNRIRPVGLFLPPSYLNPFFEKRKFLLRIFNRLEIIFTPTRFSNYADHFFIELQKKN